MNKPTKLEMKILLILCAINIIYWGISEHYIGNGSFLSGALEGFLVTLLCAVIPFFVVTVFHKIKNR